MEPSRRAGPSRLARLDGLLLFVVGLLSLPSPAFADPAPPSRPVTTPFLNMPPRLPLRPGQWVAVRAFPHLHFEIPTFLAPAPRSDRFYLCEHEGVVKSFVNNPETTEVVKVLDISSHCQAQGDCGLLGLAFHPDFGKPDSPNRGYFYICYNHTERPVKRGEFLPKTKKTEFRLSRFTIPDGSLVADPDSELVLIGQLDEHVYHSGGAIFFHPDDGFLYMSVGDEGDDGGALGNCQRIDRDLFAGVLRIDVDCDPTRSHPPPRQPETGKTAHYFIPNDNPFVGVPNALEEFWCLGLRNPHRMTYDPETKTIWVGDVGQGGDAREEVNLVEKGANFQWNYMEGTLPKPHFAKRPEKVIGKETSPLYEYPHSEGNHCIIGGYIYRGREHAAELGGKYVFGDHGSGRIWALSREDGKSKVEELCQLPPRSKMLNTFGVDHQGELYLCEMGTHQLWKLARAGTPAAPLADNRPLPRLLSETGTFSDTSRLTPAPGVMPYSVNSPLWSDGAAKWRWIAVPTSEGQVQFRPTDFWKFPAGTVLVKHFELSAKSPKAPPRRLETRLIVCDHDGAGYGVTYRWREDQTDAELLDGGLTETVCPPGGQNQAWTYPSRADCLTCHNVNAGFVLGVNTRQLNREQTAHDGVKENQLKTWARLGLIDHALTDSEISTLARLVAVGDKSADLETRVRSYLDANCSHCHRPWGARAQFDARFETPPEKRQLVGGQVLNTLGIEDSLAICPGEPEKSLVYVRMRDGGQMKMPPVGRTLEDREATATLREWILSQTDPPSSRDIAKRAQVLATSILIAVILALFGRRLLRVVHRVRDSSPVLSPGWRWLLRLVPGVVIMAAPALVVLVRIAAGRELAPVWLFAAGGGVAAVLAVVLGLTVPGRSLRGDRAPNGTRVIKMSEAPAEEPRRRRLAG